MLLGYFGQRFIRQNGHDLRIATDRSGIGASVAHGSDVGATRVLSNGAAAGTRASTVVEVIDLDNTGIGALLELDEGWRSDGLRKSQHWECCDESENRNERKLHD